MSFDYIRKAYGVPAKKGGRVTYKGKPGTITSATQYVHVRLNGNDKRPLPIHPTDEALVYLATPQPPPDGAGRAEFVLVPVTFLERRANDTYSCGELVKDILKQFAACPAPPAAEPPCFVTCPVCEVEFATPEMLRANKIIAQASPAPAGPGKEGG